MLTGAITQYVPFHGVKCKTHSSTFTQVNGLLTLAPKL